jgi:hypothetical protein
MGRFWDVPRGRWVSGTFSAGFLPLSECPVYLARAPSWDDRRRRLFSESLARMVGGFVGLRRKEGIS